MQIFSAFKHSPQLELAISFLEQQGIPRRQIFAVPLTNRKPAPRLLDSLHHSDGISLFSKGAAIGTGLSVVGASLGFRLRWGPIFWGLIGAAAGFLIGFLIDWLVYRARRKKGGRVQGTQPDVILVVECEEGEGDAVERILWEHYALGTARINN